MKKILVSIYLTYLRFFAKLQLKKIHPYIVGVGGSSGKTSTAAVISQILSQKFRVKQGKGKNSETGIPLSILDINVENYRLIFWFKILLLAPWRILTNFSSYDVFVVEMGIDSPLPPKNMGYLLKILKPDLGVLTNIDVEHSEAFDGLVKTDDEKKRKKEILELISKEEGGLLRSLGEKGRSVLNIDDPHIKSLMPLKSKMITVSAKDKNADFFIQRTIITSQAYEMEFVYLNEKYILKISKPLPKYFAYSFALSIAICFSLEINIKDCISAVEANFNLPPGRFSIFPGIKNSTIIDSSYNSSLGATQGALDSVPEIAESRRKVGILGDMRELGSLSKIQHVALAKNIIKNLDFAILIGPQMKLYVVPELLANNFKFKWFENFTNAKEAILDSIRNEDVILVKGSQNSLFLERAVEILLKNKEDKEKLCRRERYWNKL